MIHSLRLALIASTALAAATPAIGYAMPQSRTQTSPAPAATPDPAPLLAKWPGPHEGVPQWDKVAPAMFPPAFERAMANARAEMAKIRDNSAAPTFQNTIEAGERSGEELNRLFAVWGVYQSNLATPQVQAIAKEWSPKLSAFFTEMSLDPKMFARVKAIYDHRAHAGLNPQQLRLLERSYRDYVTSGALLDQAGKIEIKRINQALATAYTEFSRKVLADEETAILLDSETDLAGLADSFKASLAEEAKARGATGKWAIKNTRSSVQPFLMYATNRALREKVYKAFVDRGDNGDANDTNATIAEILKLRQERRSCSDSRTTPGTGWTTPWRKRLRMRRS